jgi:hypothetical protein
VDFFKEYVISFPDEELNATIGYYPILEKYKSKTELGILHGHKDILIGVRSATTLLHSGTQ